MHTEIEVNGEVVSYSEMVKRLFKPMEGVGARMMHAAIGCAGESGEIRESMTRDNLIKELGDFEFYVEAAWQQMEQKDLLRYGIERAVSMYGVPAFGDMVDELHLLSSQFIDLSKKVWVYGGSKGMRDEEIAELLVKMEATLAGFYGFLGVTRQEVQFTNMKKLIGGENGKPARYASGHYSDAEALARADDLKPRKFMTDAPRAGDVS